LLTRDNSSSAMANYAPRFFTHSMKRVPRIIDQFPNKLKFKARMTRNKWSHKAAVAGKLVILPEIDELEKIRDPHGFPKFLKQEIQDGVKNTPLRRLLSIGDQMTELIRNERIEGRAYDLQDTRLYTELLLQLAIANGDRHRPTMEMVNFYIKEKDLIPKLFQVLVPRYVGNIGVGSGSGGNGQQGDSTPLPPSTKSVSLPTRFTDFYKLPPDDLRFIRRRDRQTYSMKAILELRGNPWPAVVPKRRDHSGLITNVLLEAAKRGREEAGRKRAVASIKAKVADVKESMEPKISSPLSAAAVASASSSSAAFAASAVVDNPYAEFEREKMEGLSLDSIEEENFDDDDDVDLDLKLKNLDLNLN